VDSSPANKVFAQQNGLTFPLLSDFQRNVSKEYGIFNEEHGFANRATFVIDKNGAIQHIDKGKEALDPSGAGQACSRLEHDSKNKK
jgi:peroxiredoxin (alkyl hydroperoxide reductase subunit C)